MFKRGVKIISEIVEVIIPEQNAVQNENGVLFYYNIFSNSEYYNKRKRAKKCGGIS